MPTSIKPSEAADAARRGCRVSVKNGRMTVDQLPSGGPLTTEPSIKAEIKAVKGRVDKIEKDKKP